MAESVKVVCVIVTVMLGTFRYANGVCACEKCNCNPQGVTVNSTRNVKHANRRKKTCNMHTKEKEEIRYMLSNKRKRTRSKALTYET